MATKEAVKAERLLRLSTLITSITLLLSPCTKAQK